MQDKTENAAANPTSKYARVYQKQEIPANIFYQKTKKGMQSTNCIVIPTEQSSHLISQLSNKLGYRSRMCCQLYLLTGFRFPANGLLSSFRVTARISADLFFTHA